MRVIQRTLAIVALLTLTVQTTQHAYVLYLEPRGSILDRFDQPVRDQIDRASSIDELVTRYEAAHSQAEQARANQDAKDPNVEAMGVPEREPFRSEYLLRAAITDWEAKAKEVHALHFYWLVGLVLVILSAVVSAKVNRWFGLTLVVTGFSEIIYWTSPVFWGESREVARLLAHKLWLSAIGLAVLLALVWFDGVFSDDHGSGSKMAG